MRLMFALAVLLALTGCTKSVTEMSYTELREYTISLMERCRQQGVPPEEIKACTMHEFHVDQNRRDREIEIARAFASASAEFSRASQANRPIHCTSAGAGHVVHTTCR